MNSMTASLWQIDGVGEEADPTQIVRNQSQLRQRVGMQMQLAVKHVTRTTRQQEAIPVPSSTRVVVTMLRMAETPAVVQPRRLPPATQQQQPAIITAIAMQQQSKPTTARMQFLHHVSPCLFRELQLHRLSIKYRRGKMATRWQLLLGWCAPPTARTGWLPQLIRMVSTSSRRPPVQTPLLPMQQFSRHTTRMVSTSSRHLPQLLHLRSITRTLQRDSGTRLLQWLHRHQRRRQPLRRLQPYYRCRRYLKTVICMVWSMASGHRYRMLSMRIT